MVQTFRALSPPPDYFYGALANLSLSTDPLTDNRYALAGANPISFEDWNGHFGFGDIVNWAGQHKADIAAGAAGLAVGVGCEAIFGVETAGLATIGCAAAAGAASNLVAHALTSKDQSVQGYVAAAGEGALEGAATFGLAKYGGGFLKAGVKRLLSREVDDALPEAEQAATHSTTSGGGATAADTPAPGERAEITLAQQARSRAEELHSVLDPRAQQLRATAVLKTTGADIVASGKRDLDPVQRRLLNQEEEIEARDATLHAEETVLAKAGELGGRPRALGVAGQEICPECARGIVETGGTLISDYEAIWLT